MTKRRWTLLGGSLMTALVLFAGTEAAPAASGQPSGSPNFKHVFVIMMENTGYNALIGNSHAPWINSAAQTYGLATSYFGVIHPSQPNYIAATAGITGADTDNDETLNVPNIVDQPRATQVLNGYMESYALCATKFDHACGNQLYERKHNPFISFADVQNDPSRLAKLVDFSQFATDLASNHVPDYSWISPNQCNDMHGRGGGGSADPCDFSNEQLLIQAGDTFLANTVGEITSLEGVGTELGDLHHLGRERLHRFSHRLRLWRHTRLL
jgi:hypothetical protein